MELLIFLLDISNQCHIKSTHFPSHFVFSSSSPSPLLSCSFMYLFKSFVNKNSRGALGEHLTLDFGPARDLRV